MKSILFILILLYLCSDVFASDNLIFRGDLVIPECVVNNGGAIEMDFGDIQIQDLNIANTGYSWKDLKVPVNCPFTSGTPKIKLSGDQAVLPYSVKTSKYANEKLVIYFRQGGLNNNGKNIDVGSYQDLIATAVQDASENQKVIFISVGVGREGDKSILQPGAFTAIVNMEMRYE